jgi:hypothetical protein
MWKKYISLCVSVFFTCLNVCAQSSWMEWEEQIGEKANLSSWEELYENLSELAEHPFNINTVTKEELEQLPFLSDKMVEKGLKEQYTARMKKLTFSQGKLLIKLVNRECNQSSYQLVKAFMGPFKAGFYQAFAALFGASLKKEYHPEDDDKMVERVVTLVENGQL